MKEKLIPFRDTGPLDSHTKLCVCVYVYLGPSATGRLLLSSLTICSTCQRPPTDSFFYIQETVHWKSLKWFQVVAVEGLLHNINKTTSKSVRGKKKKRKRHKQIQTPTNKHRALRLACHSRRTVLYFALICRLNLLVSGSARSKSICICRATNLHTVSRTQQPIMSGCGVDTGEHAWMMFKWEHVCGTAITRRQEWEATRVSGSEYSVSTFYMNYSV